jgi:hypothetical protein
VLTLGSGIPALDVFVVLSGTFSIAATFPLLFLALRSFRDGRALRQLQLEVTQLMHEVHDLQGDIHRDQRTAVSRLEDTQPKLDNVAELARPRRRLPRLRVSLER